MSAGGNWQAIVESLCTPFAEVGGPLRYFFFLKGPSCHEAGGGCPPRFSGRSDTP
jgi:hypothetical protein